MIVVACRPVPRQHPGTAWLDAAERARLERFHRPQDAAAFATGRILVRAVAAREAGVAQSLVEIGVRPRGHSEEGRPWLRGLPGSFSISHSGGIVAVARWREGDVGIDVEDSVGSAVDALPGYLPSAEAPATGWSEAALHRDWVRREAVLKAVGVGLRASPEKLLLGPADGPPVVLRTAGGLPPAPRLHLHDLDLAGRPGALARVGGEQTPIDTVALHEIGPMFEPLRVRVLDPSEYPPRRRAR
ncbi:hypothetical protein C5C31_04650 [Rathayibacter rathayi]|nr:hypothetical protein C5C02_00450 [Rathayibacter rathayi]PPG79091.1 hypothetical protein C5C23_01370 [Rathayibacter rathayi]PPH25407.1 hypothetical protein C5C31_04650 [Rathayibacter rathayi]PPI76910.1 hypothetical protein C5E03_07585 [Rathayibacter rathayi]